MSQSIAAHELYHVNLLQIGNTDDFGTKGTSAPNIIPDIESEQQDENVLYILRLYENPKCPQELLMVYRFQMQLIQLHYVDKVVVITSIT